MAAGRYAFSYMGPGQVCLVQSRGHVSSSTGKSSNFESSKNVIFGKVFLPACLRPSVLPSLPPSLPSFCLSSLSYSRRAERVFQVDKCVHFKI